MNPNDASDLMGLALPVPALAQSVSIDGNPLVLEATLSLQRGLKAMAVAAKTYALVHQSQGLVGVFSYGHAAKAMAQQAVFSHATLADWMTPITSLVPVDGAMGAIAGDELPSLPPGQGEPQPLINRAGHWVGLLTPMGTYTLPAEPQVLQQCVANLSACEISSSRS